MRGNRGMSVGARTARAALTTLFVALALLAPASAAAAGTQGDWNAHLLALDAGGLGGFGEYLDEPHYNGGPVMPSNANYTFYWAPAGSTPFPAEYRSGVNQYFEDLAHDSGGDQNVDSVSAQYSDAAGEHAGYSSSFAGQILDARPYGAARCTVGAGMCLTYSQVRAELRRYVLGHDLPADLRHEYFVLTPPGVAECLRAPEAGCIGIGGEACGVHGSIPVPGGVIVYAINPFVNGDLSCDKGARPNDKPSDGVLSTLSHEHNESITDPVEDSGWNDGGSTEVGDLCIAGALGSEGEYPGSTPLGFAPDGSLYNQVINGHDYYTQGMWSDETHSCEMRRAAPGEPAPLATFSVTQTGPQSFTFNAEGSTAPGGVAAFVWNLHGHEYPLASSSPSLSYTFKSVGRHVVALTVFAADGQTAAASHLVE